MNPNKLTLTLALIIFILAVLASSGASAALETGNGSDAQAVAWPDIALTPVVSGLTRPLQVTHAGDGSGRLFIVEQDGRIRIWNGADADGIFLDINGRVRSPADGGGGEEGLLGLAFPPEYTRKGYFYVYYTNLDSNNQVSRFSLSGDPNVADSSSEEPIILFPHPNQTNHNGGQIVFGPDGYLYIGTGDGGGGGDPYDNAQDLASLLGKILRIDTEIGWSEIVTGTNQVFFPLIHTVKTSSLTYLIPDDNPFVDTAGARPEVWALGLRNPWRFSFDRSNGDLFIADVGQSTLEEVDYAPAASTGGENYGWDILEGTDCYGTANDCVPPPNYVPPVAEYPHFATGCTSITGGYIYRGASFPGMQGIYFYTDYCHGVFWGLQRNGNNWVNQQLHDSGFGYAGFGEDEDGELYVANLSSGQVFQVIESAQPTGATP